MPVQPTRKPPPSSDEERRLHALYALDLLDTAHDKEFDALTALAVSIIGCPTALVTLVDRDRQWVKARTGSDLEETPRDIAFCDHTIRQDDMLLVRDARTDPRFAHNPLVTGEPYIRFYAGAPIHAIDADGVRHAIGAVCVLDTEPRDLNAEQAAALRHLGALADTVIAARGTARKAVAIAEAAREQELMLRRRDRVFAQVERMSMIGSWRYRLDNQTVAWSDGVYAIHELDPGIDLSVISALDYYPPHARATVSAALVGAIESGASFDHEVDFVTAKGRHRRVHNVGELEIEGGMPVAVIGVVQDITDRYRLERSLRQSAHTDELTGIANRAAFNRELETALATARRNRAPMTLVLVDLDDFKATNDTHGHLAGDDVLRAVGQRLRAPFLKGSFAARLGGDEFALLLSDPALVADAHEVIDRLLGTLKIPVQSRDALLGVSATIGSAQVLTGMETVRELIHDADTALYIAKRARRGSAHAFSERRRAAS